MNAHIKRKITFDLDGSLAARMDRYIDAYNARNPLGKANQTNLLNEAMRQFLADKEPEVESEGHDEPNAA